MYVLREAWREKKIEKYFVDFDGTITVVPCNTTKKFKITSVMNKDTGYTLYTLSLDELKYQSHRISLTIRKIKSSNQFFSES